MKRRIIKWILVVFWMGAIFYFSSLNSEKSTNQSQGIIKQTNIVEIYEEKNNVSSDVALLNVDLLFRKSAHVIEFLILGILVFSLLLEYNMSINKILLFTFIICFLYSCSDEAHQLLVNGRSGNIKDIIIDNCGVLIGIIPYYLIKRRRKV